MFSTDHSAWLAQYIPTQGLRTFDLRVRRKTFSAWALQRPSWDFDIILVGNLLVPISRPTRICTLSKLETSGQSESRVQVRDCRLEFRTLCSDNLSLTACRASLCRYTRRSPPSSGSAQARTSRSLAVLKT